LDFNIRPRYPVGNLRGTTERIEEALAKAVQGTLVRAVHRENFAILGLKIRQILLRVVCDEPLYGTERWTPILLVKNVHEGLLVLRVTVKVIDRSEKQI